MTITTSRPRKGPARNRGKEQFWRMMLREQADCGLNARAFCLFRGLSEPSFYAWRRTLGERDRLARVSRREPTSTPKPMPTPKPKQPMFVELRSSAPPSPSPMPAPASPPAPPSRFSSPSPSSSCWPTSSPCSVAADVPLELLVGDRRLLIRAGCDLALLRNVLAALDSELVEPTRSVNSIAREA